MEENKTVNEQQMETVSGGSEKTFPNGSVTVACAYCRSTNTYLVRIINKGRESIKVFHCSACNRDFSISDSSGSGPIGQ